ncbi:MAG: hypothetical protein ABEI99_01790, partial [Halobaculum sp.]
MSRSETAIGSEARAETPSVADVFDLDDSVPYETERTVQRYLSQETRHNVLQVLLGHPSNLASTTEIAYYVPRSRSAITSFVTPTHPLRWGRSNSFPRRRNGGYRQTGA